MKKPRVLISFSSLEQVNNYIAPWCLTPTVVHHSSDQVVTLNLVHEEKFILDSQCITFLVKYVIEQQGILWAESRGLYEIPADGPFS